MINNRYHIDRHLRNHPNHNNYHPPHSPPPGHKTPMTNHDQ
jgi:hypothetical protein